MGKAHRLGQPAQHRDVSAGLCKGDADIDQQDKDCRRSSQRAQGAQFPPACPAPVQGTVQGPLQGGGRLPEFLHQGVIFRRSRARAFLWRVETVPAGRERISAVSARV